MLLATQSIIQASAPRTSAKRGFLGVLLGDRKIPRLYPDSCSRLQMNGDRIMNACSNASARKMFFQRVAMLGANDVEMPDPIGRRQPHSKHQVRFPPGTMVSSACQRRAAFHFSRYFKLHNAARPPEGCRAGG